MFNSSLQKLRTLAAKLAGQQVITEGEFSRRIKNRNKIFWKADNVEVIRGTVLIADDPVEKWKEGENWQRKLSNKYNSREFAQKYDCKVAELYWKGRDFNAINFNSFPKQYVIRPTKGHSSGLVFLIDNSVNLMDGQTYSKEDIKEILAKALNQNIKLEFLIEEFLRTEGGEYKIPDDYKFYMFNGKLATIQVINRLGPSKGFTSCYNENWQQMENVNIYYSKGAFQMPPGCLKEMIEKAKELSEAYEIFCRIDFYATDRGAVFGEFTPTPFMGNFFTLAADKLFVNYWDKFCKGKI